MRVLLENQPLLRAGLAPPPHRVKSAHAGIPGPGKHELLDTTCLDQLVIDEIRRQPDGSQSSPLLADDLMPGGKANQVREPVDDEAVAIVHRLGHGLLH